VRLVVGLAFLAFALSNLAALLFWAGCALSLAFSLLTISTNQSLLAGRGAGLLVIASMLGQLLLLLIAKA